MALLKFGQESHVEQLRSEGLMYCNTLQYFRALEADGNRSDPDEGLAAMYQSELVDVVVQPPGEPPIVLSKRTGSLIGQVKIVFDESLDSNIYCMYAVTRDSLYVDPRNYEFGPWCLVIHDSAELRRRITDAALRLNVGVNAKFVEYYDSNIFHGRATPFKKSDRFRFQRELRFVFTPGQGKPFLFPIGSIVDISDIVRSTEINSHICVPYDRRLVANLKDA